MHTWDKVKAMAKAVKATIIKRKLLSSQQEEDRYQTSALPTIATTSSGTSETPVLHQPPHSEERREPLEVLVTVAAAAAEMAVPSDFNTALQPQISDATSQHSNVGSHQAPEVVESNPQDLISIAVSQTSNDEVSAPRDGHSQQNSLPTQPESSRDLWKEAAHGLDKKEREQLDSIKKPETSPSQSGDPSREDVDVILSNVKKMKEEDKKKSWRPVSHRPVWNINELR